MALDSFLWLSWFQGQLLPFGFGQGLGQAFALQVGLGLGPNSNITSGF